MSGRLLADLLDEAIAGHGRDAPSLISADGVTSFGELAARARAFESLARRTGVVALLGPNHVDWVAAYYGVPSSGRPLCFLNHRLARDELLAQLRRSGASALVADAAELERLRPEVDELAIELHAFGGPLGDPEAAGARPSASTPAWLLFTSGTTGTPKGALLSHEGVLAALRSSAAARPVASDELLAFPFPLCHVAGYNVPRLHAHGRPVLLLERFEPRLLVDRASATGVTSLTLAATMLSDLLDHLDRSPEDVGRLSGLRSIVYGASPMPVELLRRADALLGVELSQGFGMTELSGNAVFLDAADHRRGFTEDPSVLAAAGRPGPGVELAIVGSDDERLPAGSVGEIAVRAEQAMVGYLDDPDATAHALRGGWMHTGDLGRIRPDGLLEVVDRLKDMIVTGGENVASLEVERAITASCPEVAEVAVVGVPDPRWGENVCACVSLVEGGALDVDELARRLDGRLAGFKTPRHLVVVDALPLTHSGKVAKAELRQMLDAEPAMLGPRRGR